MKQFNIFGEIDILTDEGTVFKTIPAPKLCEICYKPSDADCCSDKCAEKWIKLYLDF